MSDRRTRGALGAAVLVAVLTVSTLGIVPSHAGSPAATPSGIASDAVPSSALAQLASAPLAVVPDNEPGVHLAGAVELGPSSVAQVPILFSFGFSNASRLATLLAGISTPGSSTYHHFLTQSQFDQQFGFSPTEYAQAVAYLRSFGVQVTTYADRATLSIDVPASVAGAIFHTTLATFAYAGFEYYAPTGPLELPSPLARMVGSVEGLSSYSAALDRTLHTEGSARPPPVALTPPVAQTAGYLAPPTIGSVQYEYAPDFQIAYDEPSLLQQEGYPTNEVVATILWSGVYNGSGITTPYGSLVHGEAVGPYVPGDISTYYSEVLPAGEPSPTVTGVPIDGAPAPGPLASYDTSGAQAENTLDLEMVGSTAPGAQLYNVYGPNATLVDLDEAFDFILNPNASYSGLRNVSVISNSWGGTDANDTVWYNLTEEAAARGITVLAASGDSGDDPSGPGATDDPSGQVTFFPASMAYNDFGDVAVGGTTVVLNSGTLQISSDVAWWISPNDTADHGPAGSTGGISAIFAEPSWQTDTSANAVIAGAGRGVPDIAALANNTLFTISINGLRYDATNASVGGPFYYAGGTSVSAPLEAGILADTDHVLGAMNDARLGFVDPPLYQLANLMNEPITEGATVGFIPTGAYSSPLPTSPFYDIVSGGNYLYSALPGYDLVTGWGSIDAYNFTMYFATYDPQDVPGDLDAVRALLNISGFQVTSTFPGGGVNTNFNASLQQNFFLADSLGAPLYWVQNVVYIYGAANHWAMNFTGWVVFPFFGLYYYEVIYEYNFPLTGKIIHFPQSFDITTRLENTSEFDQQSVVFSFGVSGTPTLTLPVPGASFIIGDLSYNYSWGGQNYSDGPYPAPYGGPGGLSPQFGVIGGPSGGTGNFGAATNLNLSLYLERSGTVGFLPGETQVFGEATTQTGETAANLSWEQVSPENYSQDIPAVWNVTYVSGAADQGILVYDGGPPPPRFPVSINETGLPAGSYWGAELGPIGSSPTYADETNLTNLNLLIPNGTYRYTILSPGGWTATPKDGDVTVQGTVVWLNVTFAVTHYTLNFTEAGLPGGLTWWVNITNGSSIHTNQTYLVVSEPNGTVGFSISGGNWQPHPARGLAYVDGQNLTVPVSFTPPLNYEVSFVASGLPSGALWNVTLGTSGPIETNSTSIDFEVPNGSYAYHVRTNYPGFIATPATGSAVVNGSGFQVSVQFGLPTYTVLFAESGLPSGDAWSIVIDHGPTLSVTGGNVTWSTSNGTYNFTVYAEVAGWASNVTHANVTISGRPDVVELGFAQVTYTVGFALAGLPPGTNWTLTVGSEPAIETSGTSLGLTLPNGTYSYRVGVPAPFNVTPLSGTFTVAGLAQTVNLTAFGPPAATSSHPTLSDGEWAGLLGAVAIAAVALGYFASHRRRRGPTPPPDSPTPPSP